MLINNDSNTYFHECGRISRYCHFATKFCSNAKQNPQTSSNIRFLDFCCRSFILARNQYDVKYTSFKITPFKAFFINLLVKMISKQLTFEMLDYALAPC